MYLQNQLVGMFSILPFPNGAIKNAFRGHRFVVLPDFQGLGVATKVINEIAKLYTNQGLKFYIRASHIKMAKILRRNKDWIETPRSGQVSPQATKTWKASNRIAYSFKYIGKEKSCLNLDLSEYIKKDKNIKYEQINIFDL